MAYDVTGIPTEGSVGECLRHGPAGTQKFGAVGRVLRAVMHAGWTHTLKHARAHMHTHMHARTHACMQTTSNEAENENVRGWELLAISSQTYIHPAARALARTCTHPCICTHGHRHPPSAALEALVTTTY